MVWGELLLLTIPTPLLPRIVSVMPLFVNETDVNPTDVLVNTIFRTSQLRSVTGVGRLVPLKMIVAVPLFKGGTPASQFCGMLQLLFIKLSPVQTEPAGGTISPLARRTAPAENPVKRMASRKSSLTE